ncbi:MAG: hypothetical protein ABIP07_02685 [Sphingomicrobium sp.]
MDKRPEKLVEEVLIAKDSVLLAFDEHDAEIARNWQNDPRARATVYPRPLPI